MTDRDQNAHDVSWKAHLRKRKLHSSRPMSRDSLQQSWPPASSLQPKFNSGANPDGLTCGYIPKLRASHDHRLTQCMVSLSFLETQPGLLWLQTLPPCTALPLQVIFSRSQNHAFKTYTCRRQPLLTEHFMLFKQTHSFPKSIALLNLPPTLIPSPGPGGSSHSQWQVHIHQAA